MARFAGWLTIRRLVALVALSGVAGLLISNAATLPAIDLNPSGPGAEQIRVTPQQPPQPIFLDAVSSGQSETAANTLTISHATAVNSNSILLVSAQAVRSLSADCEVTGVTYNLDPLTKITVATAQDTDFACSSLWYRAAPDTGTHDIVITWTSNGARSGGGITLYNADQGAPEDNQLQGLAAPVTSITTAATSVTDGAWLVDSVSLAIAGSGFATGETGQDERFDLSSAVHAGAMSTRLIASAGSADMTWSNDSSAYAHVVAAIGPVAAYHAP